MAVWDYPTNVTSFSSLADYLNYATNNLFGLIILIVLFMVFFLSLKNYPTERAFASASFVCMILAILMRALDLIGDIVMFGFIVLTAVSVAYIFLEKRSY